MGWAAGDSQSASRSDPAQIEATRLQLRKGLEDAFENETLRKCLQDAGVGSQVKAADSQSFSEEDLAKIEATRKQLGKGLEDAFEQGILKKCLKEAGELQAANVRVSEALGSALSSGKAQTELAQLKDLDSGKKNILEAVQSSHTSGELSSSIARVANPKDEQAMKDLKTLKEELKEVLKAKASSKELGKLLDETDYGVTVDQANDAENERIRTLETTTASLKEQVTKMQSEMEQVKREKETLNNLLKQQQGSSALVPGDGRC